MADTDLSIQDLQEAVAYWKEKLGLHYWSIDLHLMKMIDQGGDSTAAGKASWNLARRQCTVKITDPKTKYEGCVDIDQEKTLVHELLHITFAAWDEWSYDKGPMSSIQNDLHVEQQLDMLAETMVTLRRSSGHKFSYEERF